MFAGEYVEVTAARKDWPFGPALKAARGRMPIREAARRADISEGRWRQLESGYQGSKEYLVPVTTTARTVVAVAKAVRWSVDDALLTAGFSPADAPEELPDDKADLTHMSDDELLAELCRRLALRHEPQRDWDSKWTTPPFPGEQDSGVDGDEDGDDGRQFAR